MRKRRVQTILTLAFALKVSIKCTFESNNSLRTRLGHRIFSDVNAYAFTVYRTNFAQTSLALYRLRFETNIVCFSYFFLAELARSLRSLSLTIFALEWPSSFSHISVVTPNALS